MIKLNEEKYKNDADEFIDLIFNTYAKNNQIESTLNDYINKLNNNRGLWHIYEQLVKKVKAANNSTDYKNKKLEDKLEKANEALNNEDNKDPITPRFKYIRDKNADFYYKLVLLYQIVYDNQKNDKNDEIIEIDNQLKNHKETLDSVNTKLNNSNKQTENEIEYKIKKNVYSEFITILGIFTAITFAIFGGINTINSISSNLHISSSNPQNLGNLLIAAAVLGIVLFGVIVVLFSGIAKITEKDYKLPLLLNISVISTLTGMFLVGCIFTFTANGGWHWNQNAIPLPRVVFSIIVVVAVYFIAFHFYRKYKPKHLSDKKSNTVNQTDNSSISENN